MSPRRVQRDDRDRRSTVVNRGMSHYCISVQWRSTFRTGDVQMLPYGGHGIMVRHRGSASESEPSGQKRSRPPYRLGTASPSALSQMFHKWGLTFKRTKSYDVTVNVAM